MAHRASQALPHYAGPVQYAPRQGIVREIADWLFDPANGNLDAIKACLRSVPDWASWTIAHHPWRQRAGLELARCPSGSPACSLLEAKAALIDAEHLRRLQARRAEGTTSSA